MGKKKDKKKAKKKEKNSNKGKNRKNNFVPTHKRGKGSTKSYKHWDKYFQEFNDALKPRGIFTRDVDGDGNCLFRSIADQLDGDESLHRKYRDLAVDYITEKKELFALYLEEGQNIDTILKDMKEDGNWGDFFELIALSAVLDIRFCLHLKDEAKPFFVQSFEKTKCKKLCHLAYHIDQHYSSVRALDDDTKLPAAPINVEVPENEDSSSESEGDDEDSDKELEEKQVEELAEGVENLKIDQKKSKSSKSENKEKSMVKEESDEEGGGSDNETSNTKWKKKNKKKKDDSDSEDDRKNGKENKKKNKKKK